MSWQRLYSNPVDWTTQQLRRQSSRHWPIISALLERAPPGDEDRQVEWAVRQFVSFKESHPELLEQLEEQRMKSKDIAWAIVDVNWFKTGGGK